MKTHSAVVLGFPAGFPLYKIKKGKGIVFAGAGQGSQHAILEFYWQCFLALDCSCVTCRMMLALSAFEFRSFGLLGACFPLKCV